MLVGFGSSSSWTGDSAGASTIARSSSEAGGGSCLEGMFEGDGVWGGWDAVVVYKWLAIIYASFGAGAGWIYRNLLSRDAEA